MPDGIGARPARSDPSVSRETVRRAGDAVEPCAADEHLRHATVPRHGQDSRPRRHPTPSASRRYLTPVLVVGPDRHTRQPSGRLDNRTRPARRNSPRAIVRKGTGRSPSNAYPDHLGSSIPCIRRPAFAGSVHPIVVASIDRKVVGPTDQASPGSPVCEQLAVISRSGVIARPVTVRDPFHVKRRVAIPATFAARLHAGLSLALQRLETLDRPRSLTRKATRAPTALTEDASTVAPRVRRTTGVAVDGNGRRRRVPDRLGTGSSTTCSPALLMQESVPRETVRRRHRLRQVVGQHPIAITSQSVPIRVRVPAVRQAARKGCRSSTPNTC